jgi:hypothetical protein
VSKSRGIRWWHVALWGRRSAYREFVGKSEESYHPEDPGVDGRIIIRWIFRKGKVGPWTGSIWLRIETDGWEL